MEVVVRSSVDKVVEPSVVHDVQDRLSKRLPTAPPPQETANLETPEGPSEAAGAHHTAESGTSDTELGDTSMLEEARAIPSETSGGGRDDGASDLLFV